jgi:hypothetical protein
MSLVIRLQDKVGSFFCGFKTDKIGISGILLSKAKKNAIKYPDDTDEAKDVLIKIIQATQGELLGRAQKYDAAPDYLIVDGAP